MGLVKRMLMEQEARIYTPIADRFLCPACVTDSYLSKLISDNLQGDPCSYCGAPRGAEISILLDNVRDVLVAYYTDPAEQLPYESREGGYQGTVYTGSEVVFDLDSWTDCDVLLEDVASAFADSFWCERDYFGLTEFEGLQYGWDRFSDQVKHRSRYLFFEKTDGRNPHNRDTITPDRMLDALSGLFQDLEPFADLDIGTKFVRVRVVNKGDRPSTARELGTAPRDLAIRPNRMSPAGIPMFYAALDEATAVLETYQPSAELDKELAIARFKNLRPLKLLDLRLTNLTEVPSIFDLSSRPMRDSIAFLRAFERDFTRRIERDDRIHTEYVPTQVVTEFIRHRLHTADGDRLDGIIYQSSRHIGSVAVVIFAEVEHCGPRDVRKFLDPEPFLELQDVRYASPEEFESLWRAG